MSVDVANFYDPTTGGVCYIIADRITRECAVVDSAVGVDPMTRAVDPAALDPLISHVNAGGLTVRWLLETHVHADHLSGAAALKERLGGATCIGAGIVAVQRLLVDAGLGPNGSHPTLPFDRLLQDGDVLPLGSHAIRVLATPGHTPSCVSYLIDDCVFVGDTLFMPQAGTARCDFPGGDARTLYDSIRRLLALPPRFRVFTGHDYGPARGEAASWESTVAAQRKRNIHVRDGVAVDQFVALRSGRDRSLLPPALYHRAVRANAFGQPAPVKCASS